MNKDGFTQISMHPHITYSDTRYLLCSTFFPHTELAKTHSVDFHPRLYILFSVRCQRLQLLSDGAFMLAVKRQGATLRVSLSSRTPGATLPGPVTIQRKINRMEFNIKEGSGLYFHSSIYLNKHIGCRGHIANEKRSQKILYLRVGALKLDRSKQSSGISHICLEIPVDWKEQL